MPQALPAIFAFGAELLRSAIVQKILTVVAISALSRAIAPKPSKSSTDRNVSLNKRRETAPARTFILGTGVTAGRFQDAIAHGPDNMFYTEIIGLADHECDGLVEVHAGGRTLTVNPTTGVVQEYLEGSTPRMWIWFQSGAWGQTANQQVLSAFGGRYTNDDRGRGVCYAVVQCDMRSETLFPGRSPPELRFVVRGMKLYNPALDVSLGGTHQWGVGSTYVWSDNSAVLGYNVARGLFVHGGATPLRLYGGAAEAEEVPLAHWAGEAAACAVSVPLKAGGTEPRYRCGFVADVNQTVEQTLGDIRTSCGGQLIDRGGELVLLAGVARTPVMTLTDKDFGRGGMNRKLRQKARERFNAITGRFSNPAARFQATALPTRRSPSDQTADNGEERTDTMDLGMVTSATQGQRLMEIRRRQNRRAHLFEVELPPALQHIEAGDWITWQSDRRGWTKTFQVLPAELRTGPREMLSAAVTLVDVGPEDYGWTPESDELDVLTPATVSPGSVPSAVLASVSVAAVSVTGAAGTASPVIDVTWTVPTDTTIRHALIETRQEGSSVWTPHLEAASSGRYRVTGVQPSTVYDVRVTARTEPVRPASPSTTVQVTTTDDMIAGEASSVDFDNVTGATKPEDNATVGARVGVDVLPVSGATPLPERALLNDRVAAGAVTITRPGGGEISSGTIPTGAVRVRLPLPEASAADSMLQFTVDIYEYSNGGTVSYRVAGYTYNATGEWLNCSAMLVGGSGFARPVRFGRSGGKWAVWIGDTTSEWRFPAVTVRDVQVSYGNRTTEAWASGWAIAFDTASATNVTATIGKPRPGDAFFGEGVFKPGSGTPIAYNFVDNAELSDEIAQAGTTSLWAGVSGSAKPEDNADVTATAQRAIVPQFPVIEIKQGEAGHTGTRTVTHAAKRGASALTGGTWSLPATNVTGATITINGTSGTVSLAGVATSGAYTVRYSHSDGVATDQAVNVTYVPTASSTSLSLSVSRGFIEGGGVGTGSYQTNDTATVLVLGGTGALTYAWTTVSGDTCTINNPTTAEVSVTATATAGTGVGGIIKCTVTDSSTPAKTAQIAVEWAIFASAPV